MRLSAFGPQHVLGLRLGELPQDVGAFRRFKDDPVKIGTALESRQRRFFLCCRSDHFVDFFRRQELIPMKMRGDGTACAALRVEGVILGC